nr:MAG TPA: hypothetical protein [Caudoviricetes sp.]DAY43281.1 MAG TPA: hypothetical protein [Caudoviricetes sp.]
MYQPFGLLNSRISPPIKFVNFSKKVFDTVKNSPLVKNYK